MADPLDDIRDLVHAQPTLLALVGTNYGSSQTDVEALGGYPRVVWVSEGGAVGETEYIGGRPNTGLTTRNRQIATDVMSVRFHIWGEDRENTRDIMHALVAGCRAEAIGAVDFGKYEWITQLEARAEMATHGEKIILEGAFQLPIHEGSATLTNVTTQTHRGDFTDPQTGATITGICQT
jgi:hypothetical protein